jgi:antitoxin component YwqK of YwqJK toxin-antitoxin module
MKYKYLLSLFILLFFSQVSFAQKTYTYYLDGLFKIVNKKKAVFICKGERIDTSFVVNCYHIRGNDLLATASFKDSLLGNLHGKFTNYYYAGGNVQTSGNYINGVKQGTWQRWDDEKQKTDSCVYRNNELIVFSHYTYSYKTGRIVLLAYQLSNIERKTHYQMDMDSSGAVASEVWYSGDTGIVKSTINGAAVIDTIYYIKDVNAEFAGGNAAWAKFLERNLGGYNPMDDGAPAGKYQVLLRFVVDDDGRVSNVMAETNYGYRMEENAIKALMRSPAWVPAQYNGQAIKTFRRQPLTFLVEEF